MHGPMKTQMAKQNQLFYEEKKNTGNSNPKPTLSTKQQFHQPGQITCLSLSVFLPPSLLPQMSGLPLVPAEIRNEPERLSTTRFLANVRSSTCVNPNVFSPGPCPFE